MTNLSERIAGLSTEKWELLKTLWNKDGGPTKPIAIIGMSCRFPGAEDQEGFWRLLHDGVDGIKETPAARWNTTDLYDPKVGSPGKMCSQWGGYVEDVDKFDAQFFGVSPREATHMDPQQRLLLEVSWEALENAGLAPLGLNGSQTGVFVGISAIDYFLLQFQDKARLDPYTGTGNALSIAANRISYLLDLRGPSLAVDTACSSSLVAVHLACESLRRGESSLALAGGVNLTLSPAPTIIASQARMLSPAGRCKTFDAGADGYVRGEGCGVVVMKRLMEALADNDNVLAIIRGSAINQDGRSNGLTAPNGPAQQAVIRKAIESAGITSDQIGYVEAHGTGTPLGDPIEVEALAQVIGRGRTKPCFIGAVKANIGHLEAAAGIAGLIKTVLCLTHEEVPPQLHLRKVNQLLRLDGSQLRIPIQPHPWPSGQERRFAGISSFGFGGTNAHVILEEATAPTISRDERDRFLHILCLSAQSELALTGLMNRYRLHLAGRPQQSLGDICYTANVGRSHFEHRAAFVAGASDLLSEMLGASGSGRRKEFARNKVPVSNRCRVAFLFTGQGSLYEGAGRELYETQPTFRRALEQCDEIVAPLIEGRLVEQLYGGGPGESRLDQGRVAQPVLFALEYALAQLWLSWGVKPVALLGHSLGEYVAACVAGVFSLEDALTLVATRGRLMDGLEEKGAMAAILGNPRTVAERLAGNESELSIAAVNGPENVIISGSQAAVEEAVREFAGAGLHTQRLKVTHGFHSPLMMPMLEEFGRVAEKVRYAKPQIALVSNVTGELVNDGLIDGGYWSRHLRNTVLFGEGMKTLQQAGCNTFVEIGPDGTLLGLGKGNLREAGMRWLASLRKGKGEWEQLLDSLAQLWVMGGEVNWEGFDGDYVRRRVPLPTYPFQRKRYWIEPAGQSPREKAASTGSILSNRSRREAAEETDPPLSGLCEIEWKQVTGQHAVASPEMQSWLIFADKNGTGSELARLLQERGHSCWVVLTGTEYKSSNQREFVVDPARREHFDRLLDEVSAKGQISLSGVVHLWSLDTPAMTHIDIVSLRAAQALCCRSVLHLVQALAQAGGGLAARGILPRLWLATRGGQSVIGAEEVLAPTSSLWGLGRVIAMEHAEMWGGLLDLDPNSDGIDKDELLSLAEEIADPDGEDQVAYRKGQRYAARLSHAKPATGPSKSCRVRPEGTYLITGGLGALGLLVARWMVEHGARHLILMGRSGASDVATQCLSQLREAGADIVVAKADVSKQEDVKRVLARAKEILPRLLGIVHAAGVTDDGLLAGLDWERFASVLEPKVSGAWNLHTETLKEELDFFILFSSAASLLGSLGQASYAAANAFLDGLAHHRHRVGLPASSINWGPWAKLGMAATLGERTERRWAALGVKMIEAESGLAIFSELLEKGAAQTLALHVDWAKFAAAAVVKPKFIENLACEAEVARRSTQAQPPRPVLRERLEALPPASRWQELLAYLQAEVGSILELNQSDQPDVDRKLFEMGMDSLMALELKNRLESALAHALPATLAFNYPTIHAIARFLYAKVLSLELPAANSQELPMLAGPVAAACLDFDALSEEELSLLMDKELAAILAA